MTLDDEKDRRKELQEEYKILLSKWSEHESRSITIKGWVAAGSVVALVAFARDMRGQTAIVLAVALAVIWYLDAMWNAWQHTYKPRILAIEKFYRGESAAPPPYQIISDWDKCWCDREPKVLGIKLPIVPIFFRLWHTMQPYLPLIIFVFILWCLDR